MNFWARYIGHQLGGTDMLKNNIKALYASICSLVIEVVTVSLYWTGLRMYVTQLVGLFLWLCPPV